MGKLDIKICDGCGTVPEKFSTVATKGNWWPRKKSTARYDYEYSPADLCVSCASSFKKIMGGNAKAQAAVSAALEKCGYSEKKTPPARKK